jgi:hypothetical protein
MIGLENWIKEQKADPQVVEITEDTYAKSFTSRRVWIRPGHVSPL